MEATQGNNQQNSGGANKSGGTASPASASGSPRNGREYWGKMPEPQNGQPMQQVPGSPTGSRKDKESPNQTRRSSAGAMPTSPATASKNVARTKGVPQSFGYIKRTNGTGPEMLTGGRTAHVSAVPRSSKLKVSGGTQTATQDFQAS